MTQKSGERFVVELEALPDSVPSAIRLRHFLKAALRSWGLRCRSITGAPTACQQQRLPAEAPGESSPDSNPGDTPGGI